MVNTGNRKKEGRRLIGDESSDAPGSQVWKDSGSLSQIGACIFCSISLDIPCVFLVPWELGGILWCWFMPGQASRPLWA